MELLSVIRRWHYRDRFSIREISRRTGLSRNTVRKYLRSDSVEPKFNVPDRPSRLDPYADKLSHMLRQEAGKSRKQKRTVKQLHADLVALGYDGSHNRVAAFARDWKAARQQEQQTCGRGVFVPWPSWPARRSSSTGQRTGRSSPGSGPSCRLPTLSSPIAALRSPGLSAADPRDAIRRPQSCLPRAGRRAAARHLRQSMDVSRARRSVGVGGWNARIYPAFSGTIVRPWP
jgi:hypothetical protein